MSYLMNAFPPAFSSYTGPGDITAFTAFYGTRAYSGAYAAAGGNAADLRRASDNATMTATFLATGDLDTATITTWAAGSNVFVSRWYDQVGTRHLTNATAGNQPQLLLSGAGTNSRPYLEKSSVVTSLADGNFGPATGVMSITVVAYKTGNQPVSFFLPTSSSRTKIDTPAVTTNQWRLNTSTGGNITKTGVSDGAFHYAQGVVDGASSVLRIDGSSSTGNITGATNSLPIQAIIPGTGTVARLSEAGFADNASWSSTIQSSLDSNQSTYYGL